MPENWWMEIWSVYSFKWIAATEEALDALTQDPDVQAKQQASIATSNDATEIAVKPQLSTNSGNEDILQELRDEITRTIERIAQEYVSLYPNVVVTTNGSKPNSAPNVTKW